MTTTRFCIVRHGETDWNIERRHQGHLDIALNDLGRRQAMAAADGLAGQHFDSAYTSDLGRTRATAETIAQHLGIAVYDEPGLRERHYGIFQGRTVDEVAAIDPESHDRYRARDLDHDFGGGETLRGFARRVIQTVERLAAEHAGQTLLLVTHGGVLDVIYRHAHGRDLVSARDFVIPNAAFNWLQAGPDGWHVLVWADREHLQRALDEVA